MKTKHWSRREILGAGLALTAASRIAISAERENMMTKRIPSSGESLPVVGLGTYKVFDVESTPAEIEIRRQIVDLLTQSGGAGIRQMQRSAELMQTDVIDLMQVHNLRDTALHMETIREWQESGQIRYSGLTHYTAGAHAALAREMERFKPDFIQINYSLGEREAEDRLLPLARDLGVAVLINRPFQTGRLFRAVSGIELPDWAKEFATSWGQFFLKFIISHPAVTCVIPATSKTHHMIDNLGAGMGVLPDETVRKRMSDFFASI